MRTTDAHIRHVHVLSLFSSTCISILNRLPHPKHIITIRRTKRIPRCKHPLPLPRHIHDPSHLRFHPRRNTIVQSRYPGFSTCICTVAVAAIDVDVATVEGGGRDGDGGGGGEGLLEELEQLLGFHVFAVGVCVFADEPEDVLGGEDGEEVGERGAGDG